MRFLGNRGRITTASTRLASSRVKQMLYTFVLYLVLHEDFHWEREDSMSKSEWLPLMNNGDEKPMTDSKKQSLAILEKVYQHLSSLSDDELFDMMYKHSPSFRKRVHRIEENLRGQS